MFNENSQQPEMPAGHNEIPEAPVQPMAAGTPDEPSVTASAATPALQWWDAMKYEWRRSSRGGYHLAPQKVYVDDVMDRADHYITAASKKFMAEDSQDLDLVTDELAAAREIMQSRAAFDSSGVETQAFLREYLNRAVIARKVCGTNAVSAEHRVLNELARGENGDVQGMKDDPKGFYASDVEKRERWAFKACYYEYLCVQLADDDIIPTSPDAFAQELSKRISRSIYDDAVDRGNRIKRPVNPTATGNNKQLTKDEILALTA